MTSKYIMVDKSSGRLIAYARDKDHLMEEMNKFGTDLDIFELKKVATKVTIQGL